MVLQGKKSPVSSILFSSSSKCSSRIVGDLTAVPSLSNDGLPEFAQAAKQEIPNVRQRQNDGHQDSNDCPTVDPCLTAVPLVRDLCLDTHRRVFQKLGRRDFARVAGGTLRLLD